MTAGYNMGLEPSGRELLVVIVKGTFVLPQQGEPVRLADAQLPLTMADTFSGAPGFSAPVHEIDFAPRKPRCDILLTGSAYAPSGHAVTRQRVCLRVGAMEKSFDVVGSRVWKAGPAGIARSPPQPFTQMPISYDLAFGGVDRNSDDASEHGAYLPNPAGRGWHKQLRNAWVDGKPLPNTEEVGREVMHPGGSYAPMAFGPVGRGWLARARFAGTYDERWLADVFPFLPRDFDERYYQAAPADQQLPLPTAPMPVMLAGMTPDGVRAFTLPHFEAPVQVWTKRGERDDCNARLDTILFEPDHGRLCLTWRMSRALKQGMHELAHVLVGRRGSARWPLPEPRAVPIPVVAAPTPSGFGS